MLPPSASLTLPFETVQNALAAFYHEFLESDGSAGFADRKQRMAGLPARDQYPPLVVEQRA